MTNIALQHEKIEQAIQILNELQLDCWLTFVRETGEQPDPALKLIFDQELTWHSIFLLSRSGEKIAIVARYDDDLVKQGNLYDTVITYTDNYAPALVETLTRLNPSSIALNYSISDVAADGLTHGMYLQLLEALKETPFAERFTSSSTLISRLRSRKTPQELIHMREALNETYSLFELITRSLKKGITEREISEIVHAEMARRSLGSAWSYDSCPGVKFGPETLFGHGVPSAIQIEPGFVASVDLGVRYANYCSDLQRIWYLRRPGEQEAPDVVTKAFAAVKGAIEAGKAALRPGVQGWEVDAAARQYLVNAGYPEYQHALGHSVGRYAHDGGPLLGPRWARYGETPYYTIEAGSVFTLELGVMTERGYVSQEDEVLVTADGCEWFSHPQKAIYLI